MTQQGYDSDNSVERHHRREEFDHQLIQSEEDYVKILCALIEGVYQPLKKHANRCRIPSSKVDDVFGDLKMMQQFHVQFLDAIREQERVLDTFDNYRDFTSMYEKYLNKYSLILDIFSQWQSMEFREFVTLRLKDDNVCKDIDPRLSSLPWYLYRPFDRVKEYYRYLRDLQKTSRNDDPDIDDNKLNIVMKQVKKVYSQIKTKEDRFQMKTTLLEVQLQIHGIRKDLNLVNDQRYYIYNRVCQMRRRMLGKKYKQIQIYLFNDLFIWVSARGKFKGSYSFYDPNLEIKKSGKDGEATFSIGLQSEKHPREVICADDYNRDKMCEKIKKTYLRCLSKVQDADRKQVAALKTKTENENYVGDDMSQSSMGDSNSGIEGREHSFSASQSDIESTQNHYRGGTNINPNPVLHSINEDTTEDAKSVDSFQSGNEITLEKAKRQFRKNMNQSHLTSPTPYSRYGKNNNNTTNNNSNTNNNIHNNNNYNNQQNNTQLNYENNKHNNQNIISIPLNGKHLKSNLNHNNNIQQSQQPHERGMSGTSQISQLSEVSLDSTNGHNYSRNIHNNHLQKRSSLTSENDSVITPYDDYDEKVDGNNRKHPIPSIISNSNGSSISSTTSDQKTMPLKDRTDKDNDTGDQDRDGDRDRDRDRRSGDRDKRRKHRDKNRDRDDRDKHRHSSRRDRDRDRRSGDRDKDRGDRDIDDRDNSRDRDRNRDKHRRHRHRRENDKDISTMTMEELQHEVGKLRREVDSLRSSLDNKKEMISSLEASKSSLKSTIVDKTKEIENLKEENRSLRDQAHRVRTTHVPHNHNRATSLALTDFPRGIHRVRSNDRGYSSRFRHRHVPSLVQSKSIPHSPTQDDRHPPQYSQTPTGLTTIKFPTGLMGKDHGDNGHRTHSNQFFEPSGHDSTQQGRHKYSANDDPMNVRYTHHSHNSNSNSGSLLRATTESQLRIHPLKPNNTRVNRGGGGSGVHSGTPSSHYYANKNVNLNQQQFGSRKRLFYSRGRFAEDAEQDNHDNNHSNSSGLYGSRQHKPVISHTLRKATQ